MGNRCRAGNNKGEGGNDGAGTLIAEGNNLHCDQVASTFIRALRDPSRWPGRPTQIQVIETHISWVFLAGKFAWKIKKPVRFEFLDFSTLELRKRFCEEELALNRRTAPELYLDGSRHRWPGGISASWRPWRTDRIRRQDAKIRSKTTVSSSR